jgi:diphthine-ammonia ligase
MDDFTPMNKIYVSLFQKPNPPARATVACGDTLPEGVNVMISFVVDRGDRIARQGLHVQSRSYWAPANIGPYSQALSVPFEPGCGGRETRVVYVAGQIPLEPASMEMATATATANESGSRYGDYSHRATLALQHMWRIGEAMQVNWWAGAVAFLVRGNDQLQVRTQARVAWELWKNVHTEKTEDSDDDEDDEGRQFDAWDIKYGRQTEDVAAQTWNLPDFGSLASGSAETSTSTSVSPFLAVEVDQLPRGSDIEWQGLGYRCGNVSIEDQGDRTASIADGRYSYTCIEMYSAESALKENLAAILEGLVLKRKLSQAVLYTTQRVPEDFWVGQVIPCRSVWGREGNPLFAGVVLQEEIEI